MGTNKPANNPDALYPNPSSTAVNLTSAHAVLPESYTVYNRLGQVVASGRIGSQTTAIYVAAYSTGVYFIKVDGGQYTNTLQFVKN
ncbi:MAG: T9SS type A sorting domain-containing protein [Flavobacterium sp.]|nr:MAG: T9SS type A sorting domain-containing protein [Flavobacterium sp.]